MPPWRKKTAFALLLSTAILVYLFLDFNPRPSTIVSADTVINHDNQTNASATEPTPKILLVSAFFPLSKSKHSHSAYFNWFKNFLSQITTDVYFFTTPEMEPEIRRLRGNLPMILNTSFSSPFDVPPLKDMKDNYAEMHKKDREKSSHGPELYAVWNSKPYLLEEAVENTRLAGKKYDYSFWNDAGSFRIEHTYTLWPDPSRVADVWNNGSAVSGMKKEDLIFFPMHYTPHTSMKFWNEGMGPIDNEFSEASFFGGPSAAISWYRRTFYAYHNYYNAPTQGSLFVGKDQTLINALFLLFPERILTVWAKDPHPPPSTSSSNSHPLLPSELPLGTCGLDFFYYQYFLGSPSTHPAMIEKFKHEASIWRNWAWDWTPSEWFKQRTDCKITETRWMLDVLKGAFGNDWNPPGKSVNVG